MDFHNNIQKFSQINWPQELQKLTFKFRVVELNKRFLEYLQEDGTFIHQKYQREKFPDDDDSFEEMGTEFPEIDKKISKVLEEFGEVFIKLNWKCPKDLQQSYSTMSCDHIYDIFSQLKESDYLLEVLDDYKDLIQFEQDKIYKGLFLILRKYYYVNKAFEFRCFIQDYKLKAISQRDCTSCYLKEYKTAKIDIQNEIQQFFDKNLENFKKFTQKDFVMDIYIEKKQEQPKVWLVDLNPWRESTNSLIFSDYEEIENFQGEEINFKLIQNDDQTFKEDLAVYKVMGDKENIEEFLKMSKDQNFNSDIYQ